MGGTSRLLRAAVAATVVLAGGCGQGVADPSSPATCANDGECDDSAFCNGREVCGSDGACTQGAAPLMDDGVDCTTDLCDEVADEVLHEVDHTLCDDGVFCNGAETCDALADFLVGAPPSVDDGIDCTID